jgi:hypothetical protein
VDAGRIAITGTSGGGFQSLWIGALDRRIRAVLPSCFPTALPMRMANRTFEDPDSDPEQDPPGLVSEGLDHPGLLLLAYPRPLHVSAAVLDFFPIEGTRKSMREVAAFYRRFGHADAVALTEGFHKHQYSDENQAHAFAFLDRAFGRPAREGVEAVKTLPPEALRCTPSGQVREDLPGRSLVEVIRDEAAAHAPKDSLAERYRGGGYPGIARWPVVPFARAAPHAAIAWESAGSHKAGQLVVDRYRLSHSGGLELPLVHLHAEGARAGKVLMRVGLEGKRLAQEWAQLEARLAEGYEVVAFDPRGLGETRIRYRVASVDDPDLAPQGEAEAYADPLSGVLANLVYNAQLLGRPYLLELVEDVEVAARFAREKLGARELAVEGPGEARLLAEAAAAALSGLTLVPAERPGDAFSWTETLASGRERWPIHYLMPGGAGLRLSAPSAGPSQPTRRSP